MWILYYYFYVILWWYYNKYEDDDDITIILVTNWCHHHHRMRINVLYVYCVCMKTILNLLYNKSSLVIIIIVIRWLEPS